MKTSARNHFAGTVSAITTGAVNDEVTIDIVGGQRIVAIITHESTASLGLKPGSDAFALVKASSVIIATGTDGARLSARNQLTGVVSRLLPGAVSADVSIALPGGGTIGATVTMESCAALALEEGMQATALFKASSVIVGVPG
jgi:molybdate transport system regulatory protein